MPQTFETPADFPDMGEIEKGDTKKFIIEAKCTGKEDDGEMDWDIVSIDGVKVPEDADEESEDSESDTGISDEYDNSQDENNPDEGTSAEEDMTPDGTPKTTKGVAMLILHGKPGK